MTGLPAPTHFVVPDGIVSDGFAVVDNVINTVIRTPLDAWQREVARYACALNADGLYAANRVVLSIPRQSGKSLLVYTLALAECLLVPNTFILWTAQRSAVASQTAREVRSLIESNSLLGGYLARQSGVISSKGNEEFNFANGSRIVFLSRERNSGRGFPGVRKVILDEAQALSERALADLTPTMSTSWNPQLVMIGTPPRPGDSGAEFTAARQNAIDGHTSDTLFVEYSSDASFDLDDRDGWRRANPAFACGRTSERNMLLMRTSFSNDDDFAREGLGRWDRADNGDIIPEESWLAAEDGDSIIHSDRAVGIQVGPGGDLASIVIAGSRIDGRSHIELVEQRKGSGWVVPYVRALVSANPDIRAVVLDLGSSSRTLVDGFTREKVKLTHPRVLDLGDACMRLVDGISSGAVVHTGQPQMNLARQAARKRPLGETGMWAWSRKTSVSDITPIEAATLALWGSQTLTVQRPTSSRRGGKVVVPW